MRRLTTLSPRSRLALLALVYSLVLLSLYGSHLFAGAFYMDDWVGRETVLDAGSPKLLDVAKDLADFSGHRPGYVVYGTLVFTAFGGNAFLFGVVALALAVLVAVLLVALLVRLGLPWVHAAAIGLLTTVWPFADAARIWASAAFLYLAIALYFAGLLIELSGRWRPLARRGVVLACFVASIATYEATAPAVWLAGTIYALAGLRGRELAWRWASDVAAALLVLVFVTAGSPRQRLGLNDYYNHAKLIAREALTLLGSTPLPNWRPAAELVLAVLVAIVIAGAVALRRLRDSPQAAGVRRWLVTLSGGAAIAICGYGIYALAEWYYRPSLTFIGSRVNTFGGLGLLIAAYAAGALAVTLVALAGPRAARAARLGGALVFAFSAVAMYTQSASQVADWDRASDEQERVLARVVEIARPLKEGSVLFTFGHPGFLEPDLPVFVAPWDLNAAQRLEGRRDIRVSPVFAPWVTLECTPTGVAPTGIGYGPKHVARYDRAAFADVRTGRTVPITSPAQCREALPTFAPGPYVLAS